MNQTTSSSAANQRSLVVPVSMLMGGNQVMIGQPGLPQVSGRLQSMQISPQMGPGPGQNRGMMPNPAMMMDPLMAPISMGNVGNVGNLDPQLQAENTPQYSMQPMNTNMNPPMNSSMDHNMNQGMNPNIPPHMNPNLNSNMSPHINPNMNPNLHQGAPLNMTPQPSYPGEYSNTVGGGTSLTEFTKRRNWSQRLLEELQDFLHILTPEMKIVYASPSGKLLTGYETEELLGRVMTDFIHADDAGLFIREFHESASSGQPLRMFYRFKKKDNSYVILETNGHPHFSEAQMQITQQTGPKGFFMMARQYPTKNAALLDSFLEYKIEHERLTRRIAELRKEESDDQQQQIRQRQVQMQQRQQETGDSTPDQYAMSAGTSSNSAQKGTMAPPAKPGGVGNHTALTRQNLEIIDAANSNQAEASLHEKMARFGGGVTPGHIESIEMLTGLRYREGERSRGISTGDTSPSLIRGDVGVPIPMDKENRHTGEKKKKQKIADEYVCTDCGTLDSPEWRKGPKGPKTLCNACGLRWAKKEKRRNQGTSVSQSSNIPPMVVGMNGVIPHGMTPT